MIGATSAIAAMAPLSFAQTNAKVVVIGGGFGGASAARYLKSLLPNLSVTLVEPNPVFTACPFSNLVIAGLRGIEAQQMGYDGVAASGVTLAQTRAIAVDPDQKTVSLESGATLQYDRLILSPGIDFRWGALDGYDETTPDLLPHAWKAGPQTLLLRQQLEAMEDGGTVIMTVPAAPFRCPPGPYERASLIAHYLKTQKPSSKLLILDSNSKFSKQPLFEEAWRTHYSGHLEWRGPSEDGRVSRVNASEKSVETDFETHTGDVLNIIPPQKAGMIADLAGVTDPTGWCPIYGDSFESQLVPNIHVIGDATIATPMPKSAFSANLQAKICAIAVARLLNDEAPEPTTLANTCYSYITPDQAISVVGVYSNQNRTLASVDGAGGISPLNAEAFVRETEARQANSWFDTITQEAFG
ncbi:MAG: cytochrome C [Ponticaulis sp.]|nr:cytochrome C [Ponticaulis sp.]